MALTKVSGDFIKAGSITQAHLHSSHGITTSHITEGDKLFFTNARVDSRVGSLSTSDLSEGTNLYYTDARADARIAAADTDSLSEGSTNLYYTDARARAAISVSGNALSYNSSTGVMTSNFEESPTFTGNVTIDDGKIIFERDLNNEVALEFSNVDGVPDDTAKLKVQDKGLLWEAGGTNGAKFWMYSGSWDSTVFLNAGVFNIRAADSTTRAVFNSNGLNITNDLTVTGGDITLGGTGRIQGIDTVSAGTDAVNKTYVDNQVAGIVDSAPSTLDTLNELAAALGDDANFSTTVTNSIALKAPLASPTFTGSSHFTGNVEVGSNADISMDSSANGQLMIDGLGYQGAIALDDTAMYIYHNSSGRNLVLGTNETARLTITASGNATFTGTLTASGYNDSNWNTAYTYSQVGHLPLAGGTITSGTNIGLTINHDTFEQGLVLHRNHSANAASIVFKNNSGMIGTFLGISSDDQPYWQEGSGTDSYKIWTANNDGSGSGLDADLLDGINSTGFVKQLADLTSGAPDYQTPSSRRVDPNSGNPTNEHYAISTFGNGGNVTGQLAVHLSNGSGYIRSYNNSWSNWRKLWHDNNDGSGSGLDADTLDGSHASAFWAKSGSWYGDLGSHSYTREIGLSMTGGSEFVVLSKSGQGSVLVDGHYMAYESANGFFGSYNSAYGNLTGIRATAANTLKVMQLDGGNAILEVTQDARAPIFYDLDNTGYYTNPGGTSNVNAMNFAGVADFNGGHGGVNITNTSILSSATSNWTGNPGGAGKIQYHSNRWYIVSDSSSNRIVQFRKDGSDKCYVDNDGRLMDVYDVRAYVYYDRDNTGYYLDPSTTGTSLNAAGSIIGSNINTNIKYLGTGVSYDTNRTTKVTDGIALYGAYSGGSNSPHSYDFSAQFVGASRGFELSAAWHSQTALSIRTLRDCCSNWTSWYALAIYGLNPGSSAGALFGTQFYDSNDTGYYVDPASNSVMNTINGFGFSQTGGNGKILVTNSGNGYLYLNNWIQVDSSGIFSGHNNAHFYPNLSSDYGAWRIAGTRGGWSGITFDVSGCNVTLMASTGTMGMYNDTDNEWMLECQRNSYTRLYYNGVEQGRTDNGFFLLNNQARSPIYYDSNNTAYYIDPDSTSLSGKLRSYLIFNDYGAGVVGSYSASRYQLVFAMGNSYKGALDGTSVSGGYGLWYSHPNAGGVAANLSSHGLMNIVNGSWHASLASSTRASSDMRAPIFYDLNNTTYYTRPSTYSYMNQIWTAGTIQAGSSGTGNIYLGNNGISGSGNHFRFHTHGGATYFDMNSGTINWRQGSSTRYYFYPSTANMTVNGTITQYSDIRYKENIVEIPDAIDKIKSIRGVYYNRTDFNTEPTKIGVIAQEVEVLMPELILQAEDTDLKSVSYNELTAVLVQAIKEQQTIIDDLKSRIETLENQ
jgi:hypothetical protein